MVPVYAGVLRFHVTAVLLLVLWPAMHVSIAGLLLHMVERPHWILNVASGGRAGEDQLQPLFVAAVVSVRE